MTDQPKKALKKVAKKAAKKNLGGAHFARRSELNHHKPNGHVIRDDPSLRAVLRKLPIKKKWAGRNQKYDWVAIREFYITSSDQELTIAEVARMHGVPAPIVHRRSKDENWKWLRMQYWTQLIKEKRHRRAMKNAEEADKFDDTSLGVAKMGMSMVQLRMGQIATYFHAKQGEFSDAVEKLKAGFPVQREEFYSAINYKELRDLGQAALMFQELGHKSLGASMDLSELADLPDGTVGGPDEKLITIGDELTRNDPDRIAAMMEALDDAGLLTYETDDKGNVTKFAVDGEWLEGGSMGVPGQEPAIEEIQDPNVGEEEE